MDTKKIKRYISLFIVFLLFSCTQKTAKEYIEKGNGYTKDQQYEKAIASFKKAIEVEPQNALAYYSLGGIYTYQDLHDIAIDAYKKAIDIDPTYADPHYSLGFVYEKLGKVNESKYEYNLFDLLKR